MHPYAQTNIQLFNQLQRAGWARADLAYIKEVYWLAAALVSGQYRASGKPASAHLIGTASILAHHQAPIPVVAAGFLHGAYLTGDFGDGLPGMTTNRREQVRRVAGEAAVNYIVRFTDLFGRGQSIQSQYPHPELVSPQDKTIYLIRLADELEGYLDLGFAYYGEGKQRRMHLEADRPTVLELARQFGFHDLAEELAQAHREADAADIPPELRSGDNDAHTIAPSSYRRRRRAQFKMWLKERLPVSFRRWLRQQVNRRPLRGD